MTPEVSIITPIYNTEDFLVETLESILSQSFTSWESIIINDNSPDNSLQIAEQYREKDSRFIIINKDKSEGAARARNAGIKAARGRFIAFLDSDDLWLPNKLEKQIGFMKENDLAFSFSSYYQLTEESQRLGVIKVPKEVGYRKLLGHNYICCLTAIYDTHKLSKVYMPDILKRQDFGLWLKITKMGHKAVSVQEPLAEYRLRRNSLSSSKFSSIQHTWSLYRNVEKLSFLYSLILIIHNIILILIKRFKGKYLK